jgi:hypothetical protein
MKHIIILLVLAVSIASCSVTAVIERPSRNSVLVEELAGGNKCRYIPPVLPESPKIPVEEMAKIPFHKKDERIALLLEQIDKMKRFEEHVRKKHEFSYLAYLQHCT